MNRTGWHVCAIAVLALVASASSVAGRGAEDDPPRPLAKPVEDGPFLRPPAGAAAEPIWGIKGGIAVGLWHNGGPRGLIRIYTPYLGQGRGRVMNFVAVEPIARGSRGLSELEASTLDRVPGKAMWTILGPTPLPAVVPIGWRRPGLGASARRIGVIRPSRGENRRRCRLLRRALEAPPHLTISGG